MVEKKTLSVTYKKSRKNKRGFKLYNTMLMYKVVQEAIELKAALEKVAEEQNIEYVEDLKPTLINTELLYNLADGYIRGYEKLLKENLLTSANISKIQPTIH
jgi:hypothetical protein